MQKPIMLGKVAKCAVNGSASGRSVRHGQHPNAPADIAQRLLGLPRAVNRPAGQVALGQQRLAFAQDLGLGLACSGCACRRWRWPTSARRCSATSTSLSSALATSRANCVARAANLDSSIGERFDDSGILREHHERIALAFAQRDHACRPPSRIDGSGRKLVGESS